MAAVVTRVALDAEPGVAAATRAHTLCCAAAGYALAVFKFRGRKAITWLVLGALIIPPPLILATGYEWLFRLGLQDRGSKQSSGQQCAGRVIMSTVGNRGG